MKWTYLVSLIGINFLRDHSINFLHFFETIVFSSEEKLYWFIDRANFEALGVDLSFFSTEATNWELASSTYFHGYFVRKLKWVITIGKEAWISWWQPLQLYANKPVNEPCQWTLSMNPVEIFKWIKWNWTR